MAHRAARPPRRDRPGGLALGCLLAPGAAILLAAAGLFAAVLLLC